MSNNEAAANPEDIIDMDEVLSTKAYLSTAFLPHHVHSQWLADH